MAGLVQTVRIWGRAHPADLNRKHLLGEHKEVHALIRAVYDEVGWTHHPETKRFALQPQFLIFRHELLRIEMMSRWGDRHSAANHPSRVWWLGMGNELQAMLPVALTISKDCFATCMDALGFPPPAFDHDTPWDRDLMTREQYIELGDAWNLHDHKQGGPSARTAASS